MKYSIAALALLSVGVFANDYKVDCDGNEVPDYDDCDKIMNAFHDQSDFGLFYYSAKPNICYFPSPPEGTEPNSLNCVIAVCFDSDVEEDSHVQEVSLATDYFIIKDQCGRANAGGQYHDLTAKYTLSAKLNPKFNAGSKKRAAVENARSHPRELVRRDGTCSDGSGDLRLLETFKNIEKEGSEMAVTGRLPSGSMYTIQNSDAKTVGVEVSVSVSAGFFDLFDASTSTSVSYSDTVTTTTGVNVNVDCESGQDGVVFLYPQFTKYVMLCTSDGNKEIDVWVPQMTQNNYEVRCLGQGSGST